MTCICMNDIKWNESNETNKMSWNSSNVMKWHEWNKLTWMTWICLNDMKWRMNYMRLIPVPQPCKESRRHSRGTFLFFHYPVVFSIFCTFFPFLALGWRFSDIVAKKSTELWCRFCHFFVTNVSTKKFRQIFDNADKFVDQIRHTWYC
jgi:hypothetical protein